MDRLESLGNSLSQITFYDIKSMYNQAKNVVLNVSEMEAKVRDATNDEPWGASSTLMQEIAQGTFNFQQFNEIMPCIYARFMEKEARQWRQIYKALQLLEYLIKNGSERVVDDARSHIATIKMLRNFYYVDEKAKDQGINVRNRSKEIVELLSDVESIRAERRKAKANKSKYTGTGNEGGWGLSTTGSRYGGFGSDSLGSGNGGGYGGGGYDADSDGNYGGGSSYSGGRSSSGGGGGAFRDNSGRNRFQEYDAGEDETPRRSNSISNAARLPGSTSTTTRSTLSAVSQAPAKAKGPVKEVDLLGFADDDPFPNNAPAPSAVPGMPSLASPSVAVAPPAIDGDDDFDDFQAAPPAVSQLFASPAAPVVATPPIQPQRQSVVQTQQAPTPPNFFNNVGVLSPASVGPQSNYISPITPSQGFNTGSGVFSPTSPPPRSNVTSPGSIKPTPTIPAKSNGSNFDDLWSMSLGSSSTKPTSAAGPAKSMKDLEKEKTSAGIWGPSGQQGKLPTMGMGLGGSSMGGPTGTSSTSGSGSNGMDDLLL